jgi:hypothetical protein
VQALGLLRDEAPQRLGDRRSEAAGFLVFEFLQKAVDGGLRAGVTEFRANAVDGRSLSPLDQAVVRIFDVPLEDPAPGHDTVRLFRTEN